MGTSYYWATGKIAKLRPRAIGNAEKGTNRSGNRSADDDHVIEAAAPVVEIGVPVTGGFSGRRCRELVETCWTARAGSHRRQLWYHPDRLLSGHGEKEWGVGGPCGDR